MTRARTALAALIVGMAWIATPAQAHNYLVSSTPEADATLTELPEEFAITTNDVLLDLGGAGNAFALQVRDAAGLYYGDGCVTIDGASMTSEAVLGEPGEYTVRWQVVSTDGHPVSDEFAFTWAPTDVADATVGADAAPVCGAETETEATGGGAADDASPATAQFGPTSAATPASTDGWWIGGSVAAVALAAVLAVALTRRRRAD